MDKQNLLVLTRSFPDKHEKFVGGIFIKEQVKALSEFFDNIYVVVPLPYGIQLKRKAKFEDYKILPNIHVHFIKYINFPLFYRTGKRYWITLEKKVVIKWLTKEKIDNIRVIHAHYTFPSGAVAVDIKKILDVPVVITEHTSKTFLEYISKKDPLIIRTWKSSDAIIRVRKKDIPLFAKVGIDVSKVHYVPNGFDPKLFHPMDQTLARKKLGLPLDRKIILNVANLVPVKGHEYLIQAMKKVVKQKKDVLLVIVGGGPLKSKLQQRVTQLGLDNYIKFVGARPHEEIPLWMNAADLFVLPSLSEGNPTVMFEALGVGLPFIGTTAGGIPEIITSEDYGFLCPPKDPECLAEKILIALEKEWDREKIRKYAEQFTWEEIAKQVINVYENLSAL